MFSACSRTVEVGSRTSISMVDLPENTALRGSIVSSRA
jgi:hypothetical protein